MQVGESTSTLVHKLPTNILLKIRLQVSDENVLFKTIAFTTLEANNVLEEIHIHQ